MLSADVPSLPPNWNTCEEEDSLQLICRFGVQTIPSSKYREIRKKQASLDCKVTTSLF